MESFKSTPHSIACDAATIYSKLTNPSLIQQQIEANADRIDEQARQHLDTVKFTEDSISIQSPMGEVALSLDRENSIEDERVVYTASSSPVPINMVINLQSQDDGTTMSTAELQLQLPFFLRKMVVMKHIISLSSELGMTCIAEGAETVDQVDLLFKNGCTRVQGYFFDKPLPVRDFCARLENPRYTQEHSGNRKRKRQA